MKKIFLLLTFPICVHASVICVDDNNAATQNGSSQYPYSSIQMAITNAADFDTIKVAAGSYTSINNMGKPLTFLGGYQGGTTASYNAGTGGNFSTRTPDPALTKINAGIDSIGVNLTRFTFDPFRLLFDNFTVSNKMKGIVCDVEVSWPPVDSVTISNNIIEDNGQAGITSYGAGIFLAGNHQQVLNNIIRNNRGGRGPGISGNFSTDSVTIDGNRIENNTGYDDHAGGIYLGGFVVLTHNIISGNHLQNSYGWGGGVLILGVAHMSFNIIKDNFCPSYGGGVFVDEGGVAYMDHELIYRNTTSYNGIGGAGVALDNGTNGSSYVYMTNCTVANNFSPDSSSGNAVFVDVSSFCTVKNCIMYGNGHDFFESNGSTITVTFTLNQDGKAGLGNFIANPLFYDSLNGDFHLKSRGGRFNPSIQSWVIDSVHSPAIDAGDSTSSFASEPSPNGNRINLGCYGNTPEASKTFATGIEDLINENAEVIVYPNPSNGKFLVFNRNYNIKEIEVYDFIGAKIMTVKSNAGLGQSQMELDFTHLSEGIYFLLVQTEKFVTSKKIILAR